MVSRVGPCIKKNIKPSQSQHRRWPTSHATAAGTSRSRAAGRDCNGPKTKRRGSLAAINHGPNNPLLTLSISGRAQWCRLVRRGAKKRASANSALARGRSGPAAQTEAVPFRDTWKIRSTVTARPCSSLAKGFRIALGLFDVRRGARAPIHPAEAVRADAFSPTRTVECARARGRPVREDTARAY
ncbi:hypothetical protein EVAR_9547_1 [Eumeta japonica]|uniref:Uncharacterized protein n=1 Tax=Eumeta variegata TaxID=151549 RepID=A0A4C1U556_EUMVA|nr:hypothetical protein EVAR_9547_1 [Eumeta japonica]